jgi:hypothetical protein
MAPVDGYLLGGDLGGTAIPHLGNKPPEALLIPFERYRRFTVDPEVFEIARNE